MASRDSLDLFGFLNQLNSRNLRAYDQLEEDAKKAAHPLVIMRWLSGTGDEAQIIRLNTFVNPYVFSLGQEKELLFKLLAASCTGPKRNQWLKGPGTKGSGKLAIKVLMEHFDCTARDAGHLLPSWGSDDVLQCAEELGWDKADITKLKAELAKDSDGSRGTEKASKKPKAKR